MVGRSRTAWAASPLPLSTLSEPILIAPASKPVRSGACDSSGWPIGEGISLNPTAPDPLPATSHLQLRSQVLLDRCDLKSMSARARKMGVIGTGRAVPPRDRWSPNAQQHRRHHPGKVHCERELALSSGASAPVTSRSA